MKLVLANNQTERFVDFYSHMAQQSSNGLSYDAYQNLLFHFGGPTGARLDVKLVGQGKRLIEFDGVYINGYLSTYELAAATALACEALKVPYVNKELSNAPSLSKLTSYVKLSAAGVPIPETFAGAKAALARGLPSIPDSIYPAVLKRADADRGIDNFKVTSSQEVAELTASHENRSLWVLQKFVPNDGYYVVSFYASEPKFCIFRSLEERPDGNQQKAHMYKPKGGANAQLIDIDNVPPTLIEVAAAGMAAMNRQIGSVDCLYDSASNQVHVLEVNYNPQLVTIETFKDVRVKAFLENLEQKW